MFKLSSALVMVAMVCALILALVYKQTSPIIEEQKQLLLERSLKEVLLADKYTKHEEDIVYYEAIKGDGRIAGWCLPISSKGYGGSIQILAGVDTSGKVTGVKVLEHKETPGLGSKIVEKSAKESEAPFLKQFKQKKVSEIVLVKGKTTANIEAITGATISSKAITQGVRLGVESFLTYKDK